VIASKSSSDVVMIAAQSRHDVVRVSAAAAAAILPGNRAVDIVAKLLNDADPGVRLRATKSAGTIGNTAFSARLREMATHDPVPHVRELAAEIIKQRSDPR
jgi:HEAT repeat protein